MSRAALTLILSLGLLLPAVPLVADPLEDPEELDALPEPSSPVYRYLKTRSMSCAGDHAPTDPAELGLGGQRYVFRGTELTRQGSDPDGVLVLGVLGATKDASPETLAALARFLTAFKKEQADALLLLGDLAESESDMVKILLTCARSELPVFVLIGNTEGRGAFNRALLSALKVAPNLVNLNVVQQIALGGATLLALPGYYDRKFIYQNAGCTYGDEDLRRLDSLAEAAPKPVLLVSHGPPRGEGKGALDFTVEGGNVGDAKVRAIVVDQKIPFGVFSHILEAGGQATDLGGKPVAPNHWADSLFVNVGSANPLRWDLNGGGVGCGLAGVLRIKSGKASYAILRNPCDAAPAADPE